MSYHSSGRQSRIRITESSHELGQRVVLGGFVGNRIGSFEFHADREVIAGRAAVVAGLAGMPRSIGEPDELREPTIARHEQVRGHLQITDFRKIRVHVERQRIREKPLDPWTAEFTRRQADAVHDDQFYLHASRAGIAIAREHVPRASHQSALKIDLQVNASAPPKPPVAYATIGRI